MEVGLCLPDVDWVVAAELVVSDALLLALFLGVGLLLECLLRLHLHLLLVQVLLLLQEEKLLGLHFL